MTHTVTSNAMRIARSLGTAVLASNFFVGCAGGSQQAAAPSESSSATSASSSAPPTGSSAPAEAASAAPADSAAPAAAGSAPTKNGRSPRDVLELKDTYFFFAFDESDPKKGADAACSKSAGKDPRKMAACLGKARAKFPEEGYRFEQEKDGANWWYIVHRKGNVIVTDHKVHYTYGPQTETTIVIKPEGKDHGGKAWGKPPAEVKFEVPTEYRIVVDDPTNGKMVYEAKSGIAGPK